MKVLYYPFHQSQDTTLIKQAILEANGTIVYPTETFYALGCAATVPDAVKQIYTIKQRDAKLPLLVLINSWEMLDKYAKNVTQKKREFLKKFWPGPLTVILETHGNLAEELNYSGTTLGFRMTSSSIAGELIRIIGVPLVGTSANRSTEPEISDFSKVQMTFGNQVDLYIDGGKTPGQYPSTLIDMSKDEVFTVIRKGVIDLENHTNINIL